MHRDDVDYEISTHTKKIRIALRQEEVASLSILFRLQLDTRSIRGGKPDSLCVTCRQLQLSSCLMAGVGESLQVTQMDDAAFQTMYLCRPSIFSRDCHQFPGHIHKICSMGLPKRLAVAYGHIDCFA